MKLSKESATLWSRANKKTDAQNGLDGSDPADAFTPPVPIHTLIEQVNTNPGALSQLARRAGELTDAQRVEFLTKYSPPEPKAAKAKPKAAPVSRSFKGLSAARLGFRRCANS